MAGFSKVQQKNTALVEAHNATNTFCPAWFFLQGWGVWLSDRTSLLFAKDPKFIPQHLQGMGKQLHLRPWIIASELDRPGYNSVLDCIGQFLEYLYVEGELSNPLGALCFTIKTLDKMGNF